MAMRTITHLYDTYEGATSAVRDLEAAGVPHSDISIVAGNRDNRYPTTSDTVTDTETHTGTGTGIGATVGTLLGGGAGLLAGIGSLAIPGVGPVVAAGWLIASLTGAGVGAGAGGLLGSLTGAGHTDEDAAAYSEGVSRGGTLVTVRVDDAETARIEDILSGHSPVNLPERVSQYRAGGWTHTDPVGATTTTTTTMGGTTMSGTTPIGGTVPPVTTGGI